MARKKLGYDLDKLDDDILNTINQPEVAPDLLGKLRGITGVNQGVKPPTIKPTLPKFPRMPKI